MVLVRVEADVRPTEDPALVQEAALRFLPDAVAQFEGTPASRLVAVGHDLQPLRSRVWELRIIDTVRGKLLHGLAADGRGLAFAISKQAALAGKVSFPPRPHVLGDLQWTVTLEEGDPWPSAEALAWWLCPETKDGEIVAKG